MIVTSLKAVLSDVKIGLEWCSSTDKKCTKREVFLHVRKTQAKMQQLMLISLLFKSWKYFLNYCYTILGVVTDVNRRLNRFHVSNSLNCFWSGAWSETTWQQEFSPYFKGLPWVTFHKRVLFACRHSNVGGLERESVRAHHAKCLARLKSAQFLESDDSRPASVRPPFTFESLFFKEKLIPVV